MQTRGSDILRHAFDLTTRSLLLFVIVGFAVVPACPQEQAKAKRANGLDPILGYISTAWDTLTRSMTECESVVDPKVKDPAVLYLPAGMAEPAAVKKLSADCGVRIEHLPVEIHHLGEFDAGTLHSDGLLFLPNKYVVPGGRFNEMYGWDSYFIVRGLLRAGRLELARGMVDNFLFEIENYGAMLNANRTYYLSRSQPPFLSSMFVDVYDDLQKSGHPDAAWLQRGYDDLQKDYEMWNRDPHLAGKTGLSRYYDFGEGPPAEAIKDEAGYYRKVASYFFFHPAQNDNYIVPGLTEAARPAAGALYTQQVCDVARTMGHPECEKVTDFKLSSDYYKGDRSMRESGFDVSFRFGPFGSATHLYAPVCLNSLLYKTEKDLEQISRWLGHSADAAKWSKRAEARKKLINRYLWNEKAGFFFDLDIKTGQQSSYRYATALYPLWVGLATPEQAKAVAGNISALEKPGGLAMSTEESGAQWDMPYGWGNIEMLAVEGLRRYGFKADADRISYEFLSMVAENFRRDGNIREKYNVVTRSSEAHAELGYHMNVVGFGWTNAAFLELLHGLPSDRLDSLRAAQESNPEKK
jgi:alpha,alpha-trehalase